MNKDARWWRFYYAIKQVLIEANVITVVDGGNKSTQNDTSDEVVEQLTNTTLSTTRTDEWKRNELFMKYIHSNPRIQNIMIMDDGDE